MPVRTKRWNDPVEPDDGFRVLICRYRPRGVKKQDEPWNASCLALAPSPALHAAFYGKTGSAIDLAEYERRFRAEMAGASYFIQSFAERVRRGETLTLLCSSACTDPARCHRTLVCQMIESAAASGGVTSRVERRERPP